MIWDPAVERRVGEMDLDVMRKHSELVVEEALWEREKASAHS
jgi:hypothetical protein